jgi:hypothetical protein
MKLNRNTWQLLLRVVAAVATALLGVIGAEACLF